MRIDPQTKALPVILFSLTVQTYSTVYAYRMVHKSNSSFTFTFTFMHLADQSDQSVSRFYPKRLTVHSGYTFFTQYVCSLGTEPTTFCAANAMLYH